MTDLAKLVVKLEAQSGKYQAELEKANAKLDKFGRSATKSLDSINSSIGLLAFDKLAQYANTAVRALTGLVTKSLDSADNLNKLSQSTGVAVETLSRMSFAASQSGVPIEALSTTLVKLGKSVSEAAGNLDGPLASAFRAINVSVVDSAGKTRALDAVINDMADRFASYEDGANKIAIATTLAGKSAASAIPFFNAGADGIKKMGDQAEEAGLVIGGKFAAEAEAFNDKLELINKTLTEGIGNTVAKELLPSLDRLADVFEESSNKGAMLEQTAKTISVIIKSLTNVAIGTVAGFLKLGNAIGATAAAAVQVASLNFKEAGEIWRLATEDNLKIEEDYQKARAAIWKEGGDDVLKEVTLTSKRIKDAAPSISAANEADKASKKLVDSQAKATEQLKDMLSELDKQVVTFGMAQSAATEYELTLGKLADTVKEAGVDGAKLRDAIIAQSAALDVLKNTDAINNIDVQMQELTGHTEAATIAAFDLQHALLKSSLEGTNDIIGLQKLESLRELTVAQARYNELQSDASEILRALAAEEQRITNSRESGAISELASMDQLGRARESAVAQLSTVKAAMDGIAASANNPSITRGIEDFGLSLETLATQADVVGSKIRTSIEDFAADGVAEAVKGAETIGEAFSKLGRNILNMFIDLASRNLVQSILGTSSGQSIVGALGGFFGGTGTAVAAGGYSSVAGPSVGSMFAPRAMGGDVTAGIGYRVNENTPRSELFFPGVSGRIEPADIAMAGDMSAPSTVPKITVNNYGSNKVDVQLTRDEVTIMITEQINGRVPKLMASEVADPYSPMSKSLNANTQTARRR